MTPLSYSYWNFLVLSKATHLYIGSIIWCLNVIVGIFWILKESVKTTTVEMFNKFKKALKFKINGIFFFQLKLKGLGFRLKRYSKHLVRIFVGLNHFFYMHTPLKIIFKKRRKRMFFISSNLHLLRLNLESILKLKKLIIYFKGLKGKGFIKPKRIRFLKKLSPFS